MKNKVIKCFAIFKEGRLYGLEFCDKPPLERGSKASYDKEAVEVVIIPAKAFEKIKKKAERASKRCKGKSKRR